MHAVWLGDREKRFYCTPCFTQRVYGPKPGPIMPINDARNDAWQHLPPPLPIEQACEIWRALHLRSGLIDVTGSGVLHPLTDDERALYSTLTSHLTHAANIVGVRASEVEA